MWETLGVFAVGAIVGAALFAAAGVVTAVVYKQKPILDEAQRIAGTVYDADLAKGEAAFAKGAERIELARSDGSAAIWCPVNDCPCGGKRWAVIQHNQGHLFTIKCDACGWYEPFDVEPKGSVENG